MKDEPDFREACLKLQGTLNAVATACEEVASLPHKVGCMDEFKHKQIPCGRTYPTPNTKGKDR